MCIRDRNRTVKQSITGRVPEAEPWGGHTEQQGPVAVAASSNIDHVAKDIDLSGIGSATESSANSPKTQDSQVGGYGMADTNQNPRTGKAFPR